MARPNRVFFLSSEYNNLRQNFTSKADYIDLVIKAMVSGFGPYPVTSLVIVDNVATVTLSEEVNIHPGVKLDIGGTGVTDVDGMQEIDSILGNTFTFKVASPNATFTNGITYSYLPLGWSLLFRSSEAAVLRSGNSGTKEHCVYLSFETLIPTQPIVYALGIRRVKNPRSVTDFEEISPGLDNTFYPELKFSTNNAFNSSNYHWFFYGDDSYVIKGFGLYINDSSFTSTERSHFSTATYGELKKTQHNTGSFYMAGFSISSQSLKSNYLFYGTIPNTTTPGIDNYKSYIYSNANEFNNYCIPATTTCHGPLFYKSGGFDFTKSTQRFQTDKIYMGSFIRDSDNRIHGWIPGFYYLLKRPTMIPIKDNLKVLYPLKVKGELQNRKCYGFYGSSSIAPYESQGQVTFLNSSVIMLDLTGPIR